MTLSHFSLAIFINLDKKKQVKSSTSNKSSPTSDCHVDVDVSTCIYHVIKRQSTTVAVFLPAE